MKSLKFSLTLCFSLVVSSILLPDFSYAQDVSVASRNFDPTKVDGFTSNSSGLDVKNPFQQNTDLAQAATGDEIADKARDMISKLELEIKQLQASGSDLDKAQKALSTASKLLGQEMTTGQKILNPLGALLTDSLIDDLKKKLRGSETNEKDMEKNLQAIEERKKILESAYAEKCKSVSCSSISTISESSCQKLCAARNMNEYITNFSNAYNELLQKEDELNAWKNILGAKGNIYVTIITDKDGNEIPVYFEKREDGTYVAITGVSEGCTPLPAKLAEAKQCIFCPLFLVLFNAANIMSTTSFVKLAGPLSLALVIGFGIYIAFRVMVLVSGFTKQDGPKFVTELLTQAFKVFVAVVLLTNYNFIYDNVIDPLLSAGLEFGSSFLFSEGATAMAQCKDVYGDLTAIGDKKIETGALPISLYLDLHCFILAVQMELAMPQAIGSSLMCISTNAAAGNFIVKNIIPDFSMMIQGLIIWGFSLVVSLAFAFYLIDATVRIGIVGALLPFLIATWPFKITSKYSATGFTMLMNTFFTYAFVGLVLSVNIQLMGQALGGSGGFAEIEKQINGNNVKELQKLLDIGVGGFLVLICCCLFGFKLTSQASQLAEQMAGGGGGEGIGDKIGGLAASAVKGGVKAAGGAATKGAKIAGEATGVTQKMRQGRDNIAAKLGKAVGMGRYSGGAGGGKSGAAGKAGKGVEAAGQATQAAGKGAEAAGKGVDAAGKGVASAGKALSSTGVGAIVGAPLIAAGTAGQAAGKTAQVAGKAAQAAGKGAEAAGKSMQKADQVAQGAKTAAKPEDAGPRKDGNGE